ncbi:hypothetical protein [Mycoplasma sp. P36-A1]|uniref:hypothetical protein n=1 Tax=Mycoplasma sp. P36-A1 TaxID=3252900 RepID=UPI003C2B79A2
MKKLYMIGLVLLFMVTGCNNGGSSDPQVKETAINTYVDASKKMSETNTKFDMSAKINVPKSMSVPEDVNGSVSLNGLVDIKNFKMMINGSYDDGKDAKMSAQAIIEDKMVYVLFEKNWMKLPLDSSIKVEDVDLNSTTDAKTITKIFDSSKTSEYTKTDVDGKSGYMIKLTMDKASIEKMLKDNVDLFTKGLSKEEAEEAKKELENVDLSTVDTLDIAYDLFVSEDASTIKVTNGSVKVIAAQTAVNVTDLKVTSETTTDKVTVPKAAKNAQEIGL